MRNGHMAGVPWPPAASASDTAPACDRCGEHVSHRYHTQWSDNSGELDGCRHCLPRSIRFGNDIYDRNRDDVQAEFRGSDPQDTGRPVASSSRVTETMAGREQVPPEEQEATTPRALLDG